MAKEYAPEDLAFRTFLITLTLCGGFIAVVFLFIL
jgi:hypothetical protein